MLPKIQRILWIAIFALPQLHNGLWGSGGVLNEYALGLEYADSLYAAGKFSPALDSYQQIIDAPPVKRQPSTRFRVAYAAYRSGDYQLSQKLFSRLADQEHFLEEYSRYFYIKSLWKTDSVQAVKKAATYIQNYRRHAFADSLIVPLAAYHFRHQNYRQAAHYFRLAKSMKINPQQYAYYLIQAADADYRAGYKTSALKSYHQIIRKYPSRAETKKLAERLETEHPQFFKRHLFDFVNVYTTQKFYTYGRRLLERFIHQNPADEQVEKARYLITKIFYQRGKYHSALYGFKNLQKQLKNKKLEPHLRIYIARCYRNLGQKSKAIELYLDYANRYPRRRLAAEAVWTSAWLAESLNQPQKALEYYHLVRTRWPRSEFAHEAYFREGFTWFRMQDYEKADKVFNAIGQKKWSDRDVHRGLYWSALCREQLQDINGARKLHRELGTHQWDDYYTMRSYLREKSYIDSVQRASAPAYPGGNPLLYYGEGIGRILDKIEDAFQLRLLLGEPYGRIALSDIKFSLHTKQEWIALAEVYKKFGSYGRAYQVYDFINNRFFSNISFIEKEFILKERFPFYYDTYVERYSKRYGVEKELILAVMKQESTFKAGARSWADAHGLMQLIPSTAAEMASLTGSRLINVNQLYDPDLNIRLGSRYLQRLLYQFKGRKELVLAAYNAGPHRVKRWHKAPGSGQPDVFIENIEFVETRNYVKKVLKNYWAYRILTDDIDREQFQLVGLRE